MDTKITQLQRLIDSQGPKEVDPDVLIELGHLRKRLEPPRTKSSLILQYSCIAPSLGLRYLIPQSNNGDVGGLPDLIPFPIILRSLSMQMEKPGESSYILELCKGNRFSNNSDHIWASLEVSNRQPVAFSNNYSVEIPANTEIGMRIRKIGYIEQFHNRIKATAIFTIEI